MKVTTDADAAHVMISYSIRKREEASPGAIPGGQDLGSHKPE